MPFLSFEQYLERLIQLINFLTYFAILPTTTLYLILSAWKKTAQWSKLRRFAITVLVFGLLHLLFYILLLIIQPMWNSTPPITIPIGGFALTFVGASLGVLLRALWKRSRLLGTVLMIVVLSLPAVIQLSFPTLYEFYTNYTLKQQSSIPPIQANQTLESFMTERCWKNSEGSRYVFTKDHQFEFTGSSGDVLLFDRGSWEFINPSTIKINTDDLPEYKKIKELDIYAANNLLYIDNQAYAGATFSERSFEETSNIYFGNRYDCDFNQE